MMFDINNNCWSERLFENIGIDPGLFPDVVASSEVIGEIDSPVAEEFGLEKGVKVIAGAVDTASCPMGVGVFQPGLVSNTIGTFEEAVMAVDNCVGEIVQAAVDHKYEILIIADHGNADNAVNPDGSPNTAHSLNPVPCILVSERFNSIKEGILADVAPTILRIMDIDSPEEMTGRSLI